MATEPEIGDLIEISRGLGYQHWALYVGIGYVIHLASASDNADAGSFFLWLAKALLGSSSRRPCCAGPETSNGAKVKREKLKDAVGRDEWCINNLLDDQRKPRPIEDILKEAQSLVGEIRPLNLPSHNCEHFVLELRYRTSETDQVLKIGDLIEIFRGLYNHWALYVGDGKVIHLGSASRRADPGSSSLNSVTQSEATVKKEKLQDVVRQDKYSINNLLDDQYKPRPINEILKDANSRVGQKVKYGVLNHNCEHFVTELRYGTPQSWQVVQGTAVVGTAIMGTGIFVYRENLKSGLDILFKHIDKIVNAFDKLSNVFRFFG